MLIRPRLAARALARRALAAIAVIAAVAAGATGARADGVGVIAADTQGADRASVAAALVEAAGARGRVVGDAIGEARAAVAVGAVPVATLARFRQVRELINDGWGAYLRAQLDFAQSRLAAARSAAEPLVALAGGAELYADAALRLGAVLQVRRIADAPAVLALALALDPDRPITLAEFSPDVVEAVDAVRKTPTAMQRLRIATSPAGALVSVDGRELGPAPLEAEVARGQHVVVARALLHRAIVQGVLVGDSAAQVELALDVDGDAARLAGGAAPGIAAPAEQALVDAALSYADLDEAVLAAVVDRRGGPALLVQRCAGAPARCTPIVEIGFGDRAGLAAAAREAWRSVQTGALRHAPSLLGDIRQRPPPVQCRLCRNPLVWTGVGAAVLGTAIAILVTTARPAPRLIIDGHDFGR